MSATASLLTADDTYHLFTDALRHPYQRFAVTGEQLTRVNNDPNGEVTAWSVTLSAVDNDSLAALSALNHDVILATLCRIGSAQVPDGTDIADLIRTVLATTDRELLDDQLCLITAEAAHAIICAATTQPGSDDAPTT